MEIVIDLPDEGGIIREATVIVSQGDTALMDTFTYSDLAEVVEGLYNTIQALNAQGQLPQFRLTDADAWEPEIEAKYQTFTPGILVMTPDGAGHVTEQVDGAYMHRVKLEGRTVEAYYLTSELRERVPAKGAPPAKTKGTTNHLTDTKIHQPPEGEQMQLF